MISRPEAKAISGRGYFLERIKSTVTGFDIQETKSLVSPYVAYIEIYQTWITNTYCADYYKDYEVSGKDYRIHYYFTSEKLALASNKNECFVQQINLTGKLDKIPETVFKIWFSYQDSKWVLSTLPMQFNMPGFLYNWIPEGPVESEWKGLANISMPVNTDSISETAKQ